MAVRNITVIPAKARVGNTASEVQIPKLRVAAYCRVSTESDEQATSYEAQIEHYTELINKNPEWKLAGIYADDGISGTNTKKREEFNRMIDECMAGNIDMIVTKSISRFARNTLDCLRYIRQLKDKNIPVFFEKESINTMDAKGEVLLTIMASLAQQESQSLSQNVKLGLQYRYQQGIVQVNHNRFLGYTKDEEGHLIIEPKGAEVVKRIYREYLEGASLIEIARGLMADNILTSAGKEKWRSETIKKILQNEKYIGDALLQKTYTVDFLTKKRVKNDGIVPQYYVENNHEPIIPRDLYLQVQEEMERRKNIHSGKSGKKRVYSSKYALSTIVICGRCGDIFRRVHWNNHGCKSIVWRCASRLDKTAADCLARTIREEDLKSAVVQAVNKVFESKTQFMDILNRNISVVMNQIDSSEIELINQKLEQLQKELLKQANNNQDYSILANEIYRLRDEKETAMVKNAGFASQKQRMTEMTKFLKNQKSIGKEYDEHIVRKLIEKITVYDEKLTVEFKSGMELDVEM
ncbi:DNA invertase Pin-like site-specific DNA recombinase [Hypnocyclicus thermotrophus]|uniref:DNA invertase Pin-like site-specific DNA recombinase n=1 Tax=Hypnocyclicus thermotrophus TaxID=1627895 RepID=A0AA46DZB0_9FUSO|nr:recombinase family protein [Hypnocyclicus thermotrophus]TDT71511.1 DNA invertase Pin-like site-specific DNA recombinase [Hypnocyclicus thermotrophus]